ncbi:MAG TPA: transposase family protein [Methylomicrobium sp.]|nr:transposase family protein [Methylomicrobium sp.]
MLEFLAGQPAYTMHKPIRRKFQRRKTFSKGIGDLYQADLADMSELANQNDGERYIMTCIDVFSKKAWAVPLRTKSSKEVADSFEKEILSCGTPNFLQTDKGTEFRGAHFQSMLGRHGIRWYTSENDDIKAAVVERLNRTLKEKIHRYLTYRNSGRYLDVLQDIVGAYNKTFHRSIGMAPEQVNALNSDAVAARLFPPKPKKFDYKLNVGDHVRLSMARRVFHKSFRGSWSEEIFEVVDRHPTVPVTYSIADLNGELIKGRIYEFELQYVVKPDGGDYYVVERIIKSRK